MSEELDVNKLAVEFVNQNIENFYNVGKNVVRGAADKVRLVLNNSYRNYLTCVTERYSKAKSFFIRHEPTYLYEFYVPIGLKSGETQISRASLDSVTSATRFAVLTGGGGSGKSMLMRHLFLDAIVNKNRVPIYLELRELNHSKLSLLEFVRETLHTNHFTLDAEYIDKALRAGHFLLLFDGFDEVARARRKDLSTQLLKLVKTYDQNIVLVSSRPDNEFSGWSPFTVFELRPLTLDQACELVQKLPFDNDLKAKFITDLRRKLFQTHVSFLSNPLLLSIMLLTYGQSADIPNKLNVFYNQAYEALFQRHDALKGAFQRDRSCNLDIQDFAKVFSAFSTQTYDKRVFQMPRYQALEYLEKSKAILAVEFDAADYLVDALQAVSLLVEDGLLVVFSHRSFQEYFVARFICNSNPDVQGKLISRYSHNMRQDSVMQLLFEMNPELVERVFMIPTLEKLEKDLGVKKKVNLTNYLKYLKSQLGSVAFDGGGGLVYYARTDVRSPFGTTDVVIFALENWGHLIGWKGFEKSYGSESPWTKYEPEEVRVRIHFSEVHNRDRMLKDLAKYGDIFRLDLLQNALDIKRALVRKHQDSESSLDEILGI